MNPDFYDIALAKFLQGSPELGNLIVTFKDVSDELQEDVDIKVGVFILSNGSEAFYVPVVSKADNVYPIDSIFFASKGKFFPLTKRTTGLIINSSQLNQGRGKKTPEGVVANPDVSQLINPPRTGKFVSASTSRLSDFMASMPEYLKKFTMEKIAAEKSVYENLNKLFSISDIFAALKAKPQGMRAVTNAAPVSIVTGSSSDLTSEEISNILEHGYSVRGAPASPRFAVVQSNDTMFSNVTEIDGDRDYEIMFNRGNSREAFIPKIWSVGNMGTGSNRDTVALFTNGDYASSTAFVARGECLDRKDVLDTIFQYNPPVLPRDVAVDDKFAIIDGDGRLLGVFRADKVTLSHLGVEIQAWMRAGFAPSGSYKICAYRNFGTAPVVEGKDIFVPFSTLVIKLGDDVSSDHERSANSASRKSEVTQLGLLGDQLNIGYDGVEFCVNGQTLGKEASVMERLVVKEGIDPTLAVGFVKKAKAEKFTRVYMSKQAATAFQAGEIPQFSEQPLQPGQMGLNGSFIPSVQQGLAVGDAQTVEATILSELLQAPDMYELIEEYMPDIEECIDRLGRILFLSRVHITQLSENNDADSVFAFLASLKAVYRMLGDNMLKLQELVALRPTTKNN